MKHYTTVVVPETTREQHTGTTCDMCERPTVRPGTGHFAVSEVEVSCKTGEQYPECGSGEETGVDLCADCFTGRLIPWLKMQGCDIRTKDWSWE